MQGAARIWPRIAKSDQSGTDDADADVALAARARSDPASFGPLYDRYVGRVFGYCYRRLGDRDAAEDATSVIFTKALAAMPGYRNDGPSFRSWLFAIAHNTLVDLARSPRTVARPFDGAEHVPSGEPGPDETAIDRERLRELQELLAQLPVDQRTLIELRLAGLNDLEIARVTGRSHGAVRTAQHRAIRRLREMMERGENGASDAGRD